MNQRISNRSFRVLAVLSLLSLGFGLTRDLSEPWIGLHDWNGAFYSQLARNLLRYPASVHHGMGVVAMGAAIPPPNERSIYATHPPGLVWLVAAAFSVGGESEAVARCVPILFALGSLALLIVILRRRYGDSIALLSALIVGLTPMSVYFGRMVNHEPVCLFFMLAAIACWDVLTAPINMNCGTMNCGAGVSPVQPQAGRLCRSIQLPIVSSPTCRRRILPGAGWAVSITAMTWVDWPGALFAGVFCGWIAWMWRRGEARALWMAMAWLCAAASIVGMLVYLVYAGFKGRWEDLWAVFVSRREPLEEGLPPTLWTYTLMNLQWALVFFAPLGLIVMVRDAYSQVERKKRRPFSIDSMNVLFVVGLVWVLLFLRQYRLHHYWLYYLGPHLALCAALAVRTTYRLLRRGYAAKFIAVATVACLIGFGIDGIMDLYQQVSCRPRDVEVWKQANGMSKPMDRVRLAWDPVLPEQHGGYFFRNIGPAQFAYYLDRAFEVSIGAKE